MSGMRNGGAPARRRLGLAAMFAVLALACAAGGPAAAQQAEPGPAAAAPVYELRVYTAAPDGLERLVDSFGETVSGLLEKHGMEVVGFWTPADADDARFVYLLRHPDPAARDAAWAGFYADPDLQALMAEPESQAAMPTEMNSLLLAPTDYSPLQ